MTEISDRYRKRAAEFTSRVEAVPEGRWDDQSPCPDWKARDVVRHVCDTSDMFLGFVDQPPAGGPSVDDDPAGAWYAHRDAVQAALDDPDVATKSYDSPFGQNVFEQGVDRFLSTDAVVHTWDLARATGGDDTLDPAEVQTLLEASKAMEAEFGDAMRSAGAFGPALDAPEGADDQTRVLAFLGRKAWSD